mmetsp:Transcript_152679/g.266079  ORF Transcript_152679/g.266079 Transcript_152679/m.266079 type:complete len:472 (-) Transcript_152679:215-1630(-)
MPAKAKARGKSKGRASRKSVNVTANSSIADATQRRATWSSDTASTSTPGVDVSTIRAFQIIQAKIQAKILADAVTDEVQATRTDELQASAGMPVPATSKIRQGLKQPGASAASGHRRLEEGSEAMEKFSETQTSKELGGVDASEEELDAVGGGEQEIIPEKLRDVPDPWLGLGDVDAMQRICNESWNVVELPSVAADTSVEEELATLPDIEGFKSVHISAKGAEIADVSLCDSLACIAVSLDLSGNLLQNLSSLPAMWLRNLSLADNPLSSLDGLAHLFPRLLCIDLSFVEQPSVEKAWSALAGCSQLRSIDAEGASIHDLDGMQSMPSLLVLNLEDNELEQLHVLSVISSLCKNLQCLDLRENPVVSEMGYRQAVARELPHLVEHDNQSKRKYVPKPRDQICRPDQARQRPVHMIDGLLQNERCSCLEGNPCTDPATCLDWHNRERVASNVRRSFHLPQGQWSMGFNFRG